MIDSDFNVVITDFNIAKKKEGSSQGTPKGSDEMNDFDCREEPDFDGEDVTH